MKVKIQVLEQLFKIKLKICSELRFLQAVTFPLTVKQFRFPHSKLSLPFYENKDEFLFSPLSSSFCSPPLVVLLLLYLMP
jgi:hypothetical protein